MVKGVLVPFGPSNVNDFYGMRDVGQGEYEDYLENVGYNNIVQVLMVERVERDIVN